MLGLVPRLMLFVSSYMPLYAIVAYQYWHDGPVRNTALALIGLGLVGLAIVWAFAKSTHPRVIEVDVVQRKDAETLAYLFTYVFPFLGTKFDELDSAIPFGIIFLTIAVIYVTANLIHVNPLLNLLGRHVYEVQSGQHAFTIIARRPHLYKGDRLSGVEIGREIIWV